jgi:glycosyltransferase involved in cell wall biosynthesis
MVTLVRGTVGRNATSRMNDELIKHLSISHKVVTKTNVYDAWLTRYNDIVNTLYLLFTPLRKKYPIIVTLNDMFPIMYPETLNIITKLQYKIAYNNLHKVDKILTICDFTKNELLRLLPIDEDKVQTIYQGVDHAMFKPAPRDDAIEKLGLNPRYKYITCVSNVAKSKNLQLLSKIESVLPDDVRILKAGYGTKWDGEKITNTGYMTDKQMPLLYQASVASIHPSVYEGFGLAILEACACATPIVAYKNTTQREITTNGLVDTEKEFIERTLQLIDAPEYNRIGLKDSNKFSWDKMASQYEVVYNEIADKN